MISSALSGQMHMNENATVLPVNLADSSDRNHVQVDQELFSFLCQGHMMCFCQKKKKKKRKSCIEANCQPMPLFYE